MSYYDVELCIFHCNSVNLFLLFEAILLITYKLNTLYISWEVLTSEKIHLLISSVLFFAFNTTFVWYYYINEGFL